MSSPSTSSSAQKVWGEAPTAGDVAQRLDRRVQVVLGKGGVGRTLVSTALAKRAADAGHRTLLLEVDAPDSAARQLRVKPAIDHPREVLNNLWLCRMTPNGALKEYALLTLRFEALYRLVFENRLVKYFLNSIPSLGEFTMLGKAWHHATESFTRGPGGGFRYHRIIIDAPATGHAVTFLSLARLVADIAPPGVMADASTKMAELLEDHAMSCFHLVTLPEEMPVNEALELRAAGQSKLRMAAGIAIVNRLRPALLSSQEAAQLNEVRAQHPDLSSLFSVADRRQLREQSQHGHVRRFVEGAGLPWLAIPERPAGDVGHRFVDEIGGWFDALVGGAVTSPVGPVLTAGGAD